MPLSGQAVVDDITVLDNPLRLYMYLPRAQYDQIIRYMPRLDY